MKIGLYFGTFNPIHVGHLIIANHFAQYAELDKVWLVVTPRNPLKEKESLLPDYHRLELVRRAVDNNLLLEASDIEFKLEKPSYTIHTLIWLSEKYPQHHFSLIMGEDNLRGLANWKNYEVILKNYAIRVYPRSVQPGEIDTPLQQPTINADIQLVNAPLMHISASFIRSAIAQGKDVRYLLTPEVLKYVEEMNFYR
jgi:nicotinate-nucleotide adenylyltransferase